MAIGATIYNFEIALSDVNRGVYEKLSLQVGCHPSETLEYLLTRVLAYCLEYEEGLEFTKGLADSDVPALWSHDLTGQLTAWIEIGSPSAERLHRASKKAGRVAIYSYKSASTVLEQLKGERIQNSSSILLHTFSSTFLRELEAKIERRNVWDLSVSEGQLYLDIKGNALSTTMESRSLTE